MGPPYQQLASNVVDVHAKLWLAEVFVFSYLQVRMSDTLPFYQYLICRRPCERFFTAQHRASAAYVPRQNFCLWHTHWLPPASAIWRLWPQKYRYFSPIMLSKSLDFAVFGLCRRTLVSSSRMRWHWAPKFV